ncbi:MAG: hypothetical protein ABEI99_08370 [Halobaculum sp.]
MADLPDRSSAGSETVGVNGDGGLGEGASSLRLWRPVRSLAGSSLRLLASSMRLLA